MHLLLILTFLIFLAIIGYLIYLKLHKEMAPQTSVEDDDSAPMPTICSFTAELNKFIDEYNAKYGTNIPKVSAKMRHVIALHQLALRYRIRSARVLLLRLTNFDIDSCSYACAESSNCAACCNQQCKSSSDHVDCMQHCSGVDCSNMCSDSTNYIGCRQCCERNCNINDYDGQIKCIKMCDANFQKQYSSCSDQCSDTTSSLAACDDCCEKNCGADEMQLCEARCAAPMINFVNYS